VSHRAPLAQTPSPRTAVFAALRGVFSGFRGTGAPSSGGGATAAPNSGLALGIRTPSLRPLGLALLAACALFAASAAPASAATNHEFSTTFGVGQSQGPPGPVGLAVDNSSSASAGDVYVSGSSVINKYTAAHAAAGSNTPDAQLSATGISFVYGLAVDPQNGDLFATNAPGGVFKFNAQGEQQPFGLSGLSVGNLLGIAVDPTNHHLFIGNGANTEIYEFDSTGAYTGHSFNGTGPAEGLAIDSAGHLYDAQTYSTIVFDTATCAASCSEFSVLDPNGSNGVAVDPSDQNVFVAEYHQVSQFDESANPLGEPFGSFAEAYGVGVATSGDVYVADNPNNDAALFTPVSEGPTQPLTVKKTGTGGGTLSGSGVNCGEGCSEETVNLPEGEEATVTAAGNESSAFLAWSGCASTSGPENEVCHVTMSAPVEITAELNEVPQQSVTAKKTGSGDGTITSNPARINCGNGCTEETKNFNEGKELILTAQTNERSTFAAWSGCDATSGPENEVCHLTPGATPLEVTAEYSEIPQRELQVQTAGSGTGEVTGTSPGLEFEAIDCGSKCSETYNEGATITLTEIPFGEKNVFATDGWEGCDNVNSENKCEVTMSAAKSVTAIFEAIPQRTLSVEMPGAGSGTVLGTSPGAEFTAIECHETAEPTCAAQYSQGAEITLLATATAPDLFGAWSGCTTTSGPAGTECHLTLGASDATVAASFDPAVPPSLTTEAASAIGRTVATLHGSIDPEGNAAHYRFAYVEAAKYVPAQPNPYAAGSLTAETEVPADTAPHQVTEALQSLKSGTTYHYAILAQGPGGSASGADMTFTTPAQPPAATTAPATEVGPDAATLHGSLDAAGLPTGYRFEIGTTTAYGTTVFGSAGDEKGEFALSLALTDLQPATTYHYRLLAKNSDGTATGADMTFTTGTFPQGVLPPPPDLKPTPVRPPPHACKPGFVRRHGSCVRRHRHKHHRRHGG
jgi:hypothetical protein